MFSFVYIRFLYSKDYHEWSAEPISIACVVNTRLLSQ